MYVLIALIIGQNGKNLNKDVNYLSVVLSPMYVVQNVEYLFVSTKTKTVSKNFHAE